MPPELLHFLLEDVLEPLIFFPFPVYVVNVEVVN